MRPPPIWSWAWGEALYSCVAWSVSLPGIHFRFHWSCLFPSSFSCFLTLTPFPEVIHLFMHSFIQQIGEGNGTPLQCSCLENPMDGGAWWAAVHGITKSQTRLSDFTFTFHFHALEKEMATHSSVIAWRIPWMEEPGGLQSMGSLRVRHD